MLRSRLVPIGVLLGSLAACGDSATGPAEASLQVVAGEGQRSLPGWTLERALTVAVRSGGEAVSGAAVRWEVVAGGGTVSTPRVFTGTAGTAATEWTLGPELGVQAVEATLEGGASVRFRATALPTDSADVLVVRGASGGLTGFVLVQQSDRLDVVAHRSGTDTVLYLPPMDAPGREVVVFATGHRPLQVEPLWTPGRDRFEAVLAGPVPVDIHVRVLTGAYEERKAVMEEQLASTADLWEEEGLGLLLGKVTWDDQTAAHDSVDRSGSVVCSGLTPGDAIVVELVTTIDRGRWTGWGCWSGHIFLAERLEAFPNLLAHELGHTFTLEHTATGLMYANQPQRAVREGEIYRAHFHRLSALNRIFASQPVALRRNCFAGSGSPCLPEDFTLNAPPSTTLVRAEGAPSHPTAGPHAFPDPGGWPVDGVGEGPLRR